MDVGLAEPQIGSIAVTDEPAITAPPLTRARAAAVKRLEDVILGSLLVLVFSGILFTIALAIKLTSRGPAFFTQERRGRNGTTFHCFKFRTMYHEYTDHNCTEQTRQDDPRVTRVGRFLRKHSLDELPQLFNVVIGHMALVGPRPHALGTNLNGKLLYEISPDYLTRYQVRPGITGWAQVNGWRGILDSEAKLQKRLEYDLHYINHWSLWLDLKILLKTFTCFFDSERAF